MNELARLVPFIFNAQSCHIMDKNGNPWFAAKDVAEILDIKQNYRNLISTFPPDEKDHVICAVFSKHGTSPKSRARKTQRILIINEAGVMRLILKSRKPNAWEFKERITKVVSYFRTQGINRAALPRSYSWGKEKELTWTEYFNRRQESYFRRNPDADYDDFLASMPPGMC